MELDTSRMTGIETAMSDLVASQAESGPGVGKVKGVLEKMRSNTGLLYERLARLGEVVSLARKDKREEGGLSVDRNRKLELLWVSVLTI